MPHTDVIPRYQENATIPIIKAIRTAGLWHVDRTNGSTMIPNRAKLIGNEQAKIDKKIITSPTGRVFVSIPELGAIAIVGDVATNITIQAKDATMYPKKDLLCERRADRFICPNLRNVRDDRCHG